MEWQPIVAAGFAGFGLGVGLIVGVSIVRALRRYVREERKD